MKSDIVILAAIAGLAGRAAAQSGAYAQCGGANWNGAKTCISGWTCTYSNPYYSQCLPGGNGSGSGSTVTVTATVTTTSVSISTNWIYETETVTETVTEGGGGPCTTDEPQPTACEGGDPFVYYGVNEAGAEFAPTKLPGVRDKDFTWPTIESIQFFLDKGFNTIRIPISLERVAPPATGLKNTDAYDQGYLVGLYQTLSYVVQLGGKAIVDVHNYGRYNGEILTDVEGFGEFWKFLSGLINWSPAISYDLMNEFHDMPQSLVHQLLQAGISAIRSTGNKNTIFVEGNSWSGAWRWVEVNGDDLKYLYDSADNLVFEMHQYLDEDGSGTSEQCVSETVGVERLESAIQWCEENNFKCFLGEIGTGSNEVCVAALEGLLCKLKHSPAWVGVTWWSAGPWWGDYYQSIEPPNGPAIDTILPVLESFI